MEFQIRSNGSLSVPFHAFNGVPQGDPISPILFTTFLHDLPEQLSNVGCKLSNGVNLKYILYADDLCILSNTPSDLQTGLNSLHDFCVSNNLTVNNSKTKVMCFYNGSRPEFSISLNHVPLDSVNEFNYLGNTLTTRLSSGKHILGLISKCNARMAKLFSCLPLKEIPLPVALQVFRTFITSIINYSLPVWLPHASLSALNRLNSIFTKFLKRFLCVPYSACNGLVHRMTDTTPLSSTLISNLANRERNISFPKSMSGIKIILNPPKDTVRPTPPPNFNNCPIQIPEKLPVLPLPKRALAYSLLDLYHSKICHKPNCTHLPSENPDPCLCKFCNEPIEPYHPSWCSHLSKMSVSQKLKSLVDCD